MKKIMIGCVLGVLFAACEPTPVVDESELNSRVNSEVDDVLVDSDETIAQGESIDQTHGGVGDTAILGTDNEQTVTGIEEAVSDTEETGVDTGSVIADSEEVVRDADEVVLDTEEGVTDSEEAVADTEEVVSDSEEAVADTEEVASDSDEVVADTEEVVSDSKEAVADTAEVASDSEEAVADTEDAEVASDSDEVVADTEEVVSDSEESVADTEEVVSDSDEVIPDTEEAVEDTEVGTCAPFLVINEVDYDVPGTDTSEFVEIYNPSNCAMPLANLALVFVNGSNMKEYRRVALSDAGVESLLPGEFLVVYGKDLVLGEDGIGIEMTLASGFVQNGPDGIAIVDEASQAIIDSFCYKGPLDSVTINNIDGTVSLVETEVNAELVDSSAESVSLGRFFDGVDSNNTAADWFVTVATPGFENQLAD